MFTFSRPISRLLRSSKQFYLYSRLKPRQLQTPSLLRSINLTLSALIKIQERKTKIDIIQPLRQLGWKVSQQGHRIQLQKYSDGKEIIIVFKTASYPQKQEPETDSSEEYTSAENQDEDNTAQQQYDEDRHVDMKIYMKRPQNPQAMIIGCIANFQQITPYKINFTKNTNLHKLCKEQLVWNDFDDFSDSLAHFLKKYLSLYGIDSTFGKLALALSKFSLKEDYVNWVKDVKQFICEESENKHK